MNGNMEVYNISNEYNLTELLSHFDSEFIINVIADKIQTKNSYLFLREPNVIKSFEDNFKFMRENYPGDGENINLVRYNTYLQVIDVLCKHYNLNYSIDEYTDIFTAAYYLYDILVADFGNIMENFFVSFIINNKDSIYNAVNLDQYKKSKNISTAYAKRMLYDDPKYAIISANLEIVLGYIKTFDITFGNIVQSTYTSQDIVTFINELIADRGDFFKDFYCSTLNRVDILPIILTNIRLKIQSIVGNNVGIGVYLNSINNNEGGN